MDWNKFYVKRKDKIRKYRDINQLTFKKIGIIFDISRQQVHQIYSGYRSPYNKSRSDKYVTKRTILSQNGLTTVNLPHISGGRDKLRERVRIRDGYTCQKCDKKWQQGSRRFDVHHLDPKAEGRSNERGCIKLDMNNLSKMITLCHKCHLGLHSVRLKMGGKRGSYKKRN